MKPKGPDSFVEATEQYCDWLSSKLVISEQAWGRRIKVVNKLSPFAFLRATFYRWSQWWPVVCEELTDAPNVLGIGDLHLENYGTWRDVEGRLVWGINDVDECCCCLPYAKYGCPNQSEAANFHVELGAVWHDLQKRNQDHPGWLYRFSVEMAHATLDDWASL
jgi:hypothetical protein